MTSHIKESSEVTRHEKTGCRLAARAAARRPVPARRRGDEQVQHLLGHEKIDTTLEYAMVDDENVKISHKKYLG